MTNSSQITASASFNQTNQSAIKGLGVSNTGNTAGNTGLSSGIDWVIAGTNGITASESTAGGGPNTIWLSGITQSNQSAIKGLGASNTGNTAGNTGISTGIDWVVAGSNNITISESTAAGGPNTLWVSGPSVAGAQTGISGIANSQTTYTSGTVSLSDQANITIASSVNGATQIFKFSVANQSVQTQGITADELSIGVSTGGNTSGNTTVQTGQRIVFVGSNGVTLSQGTGAGSTTITISGITQSIQTQGITADELSIGVSTGGNTSGNTTVQTGQRFVFVGSNGITLSQGTGAGSTTLTISGITQSNQSAIKALGVSNTGNTAGNTGVSTGIDWVIAGSNGITASESTVGGGPNTIWISGITQSNQSAIKGLGASNTGNTAGNTGISTGIDWVIAGSNNITVSESTAGGGPNTLWISGANAGAAQYSIGLSTGGNTSGTSGVTGTRIVFAATNAATWSQSNDATGATLTLSVPATSSLSATGWAQISTNGSTISIGATTTANLYAVGNTFGTSSGTADIRTISVSAGSGIQVAASNSGWVIGNEMESFYANIDNYNGMVTGASAITQTSGSSIFVQPFQLPYPVSIGWCRFLASYNDSAVGTAGTTSANQTFSVTRQTTFGVVIYSQGVGASSRSLQSVTSTSIGLTGLTQYQAGAQGSQYTITIQKSYPVSGTSSSYTSSYAVSSGSIVISSNSNTLFTGPRFLDIPFAVSLAPGYYWLGLGASTNSGTNSSHISFAGTAAMPMSIAGISQSNVSVGLLGAATSASDHQLQIGLGVWTTNASNFSTGSMGMNSISQVVSNPQLPFQFIREN